VRYVESVDSMDLDSVQSPAASRSRKPVSRSRKRSGTDSDFDMSHDEESSESSEEEFAASSIDDQGKAGLNGSSVDDYSVDQDIVAPKPVTKREKKSGLSSLPENEIMHEGRLAQFPPTRLDLSMDEILDSITSHVDRHSDAASIVGVFRSQYSDLVSRYPDKLDILENELPNFLMYNLANAGVVDMSLLQTTSFVGLDRQKIMTHYKHVKSVALELLKGEVGAQYAKDTHSIPYHEYIPWWT